MKLRFFPGLSHQSAVGGLISLICLLALSLSPVAPAGAAQSASGTGDAAAGNAKATVTKGKTRARKPAASKSSSKSAAHPTSHSVTHTASHSTSHHKRHRPVASRASRTARTARIRQAFVASTELRPMAQQLALLRTPEAYAGVTEYAHKHTGEAAAAAYLALGHAYLLDKRFPEAESSLTQAGRAGEELADYAEFLGAQAAHQGGDNAAAEKLLKGFADRYPDSIFVDQAPELEASTLLAMNDAAGAQAALARGADSDAAGRAGYELTEGQVDLALGQVTAANAVFKKLLLGHPLTSEAQTALLKLTQTGASSLLTTADLRTLGDAYYDAGRYADAETQYRTLAHAPDLSAADRAGFEVADAACQLKLKHLTPAQVQALPDTNDENGARRLDMLMELARDRDDEADQQRIVAEMETRFARSPWLAEALFSAGNMYLLKHEYPKAIEYYSYLAAHFPTSKNAAAAHWRAGWLNYRLGNFPEAARLFDEQIKQYPSADETVSALYWRGRLYETQDHYPALAAANYRAIIRAYQHYFYAQMARERLGALSISGSGKLDSAPGAGLNPQLDQFQPVPEPRLVDSFPVDSPHLAKAKLLANAGLNEFIAAEIKADPDSDSWSALAEAQIYANYGETYRAIHALKHALPYASTASISAIPLAYWRILYPEPAPYWDTIKTESARYNLNPYLVASLIRQESEFNPSVVSYANAWGLMQLLPAVGRQLAHEEGMAHFQTFQLLDPETNIKLGTRYLRQMLDKFNGVQEYALAAYNAGDSRVTDWEAAGPYTGMDEFVESIPFTQTREYVEAILRNEETYKAIDEFAAGHGETEHDRAGLEASNLKHPSR
jgi:soluble lytic murein transglycosylase